MSTPEALENGEFLILIDDTFHAIGNAGLQIQITPTTVYLTNFHIFLEPQFDVEITRKIALADITSFDNKTVNDCPCLAIVSEDAGQSINIFIPDEVRKRAFQDIVQRLHEEIRAGQEQADKYALIIRRFVQDAPSLPEFYSKYNSKPATEQEKEKEEKEDLKKQEKLARKTVQQSLIPFNFFADLVETSPEIFFAVVLAVGGLLSLIFRVVSFGTFTSFLFFFSILMFGIQKIFGRKITQARIPPENAEKSIRGILASNNKFLDQLDARVLWGSPHMTLELAAFFLIMTLLFVLCSPTFLLFISLSGLAFFDRWDPFRLGSLSTILSKLILW
ncbi:hypothetical protein TRFO_17959 [Tritrichomonas foetus]|uniref:Uncharacterized protein n=1 Tax=Tritrichomonas foetus TaxID=1144522 RepID=A0A1J4KMA7_9EUKA|nr:hypothetical protein TRFO_17959 [Tritrichomonas foetus]|eukprot:OHT12274.1 hypothetical protein TRFO_17959 [Tritrichomonas foetus]